MFEPLHNSERFKLFKSLFTSSRPHLDYSSNALRKKEILCSNSFPTHHDMDF